MKELRVDVPVGLEVELQAEQMYPGLCSVPKQRCRTKNNCKLGCDPWLSGYMASDWHPRTKILAIEDHKYVYQEVNGPSPASVNLSLFKPQQLIRVYNTFEMKNKTKI